jgi:hypothetical protein
MNTLSRGTDIRGLSERLSARFSALWWSGAVLTPILATDDPYEAAAVFVKAGWSLVFLIAAGRLSSALGGS